MIVFLPVDIWVESNHQGKYLQVHIYLVLRLIILKVPKKLIKKVFIVGLSKMSLMKQHNTPNILNRCEMEHIMNTDEFS